MIYLNLEQFKAYLRDFAGNGDLDNVYIAALDTAEGVIAKFVGFDPVIEFDDAIPAEIVQAGYLLARIEVDPFDVPGEQQARARVESLLRPYRRETGIGAAA